MFQGFCILKVLRMWTSLAVIFEMKKVLENQYPEVAQEPELDIRSLLNCGLMGLLLDLHQVNSRFCQWIAEMLALC